MNGSPLATSKATLERVIGTCLTKLGYDLTLATAVLKYSDIAGLERTIDAAYQVASQRLYDVFFDKFKLMDHLSALKNYILLGHGDFTEHLMEAME